MADAFEDGLLRCRPAQKGEQEHNAFALEFIGEGAANIVFKIGAFNQATTTAWLAVFFKPDETSFQDLSGGFVLRVPKKVRQGDDSGEEVDPTAKATQSLKEAVSGDQSLLKPYVLEQRPVVIELDALVGLNMYLEEQQTRRPDLVCEIPMDSDLTGWVMEDMSSKPGQSLTIEMKPKWLYPSPVQPFPSFRCRTCAKVASRNDGEQHSHVHLCPLRLHLGEKEPIKAFLIDSIHVECARAMPPADVSGKLASVLTHYLCEGPGRKIIRELGRLQFRYDGPWDDNSDLDKETSYSIAMTLRDCSLYLRVHYTIEEAPTGDEFKYSPGPSGNTDALYEYTGLKLVVDSKLADLDVKDVKTKAATWAKKHNSLQNGGWFTGKEKDRAQLPDDKTCFLAQQCLEKTRPSEWYLISEPKAFAHRYPDSPSAHILQEHERTLSGPPSRAADIWRASLRRPSRFNPEGLIDRREADDLFELIERNVERRNTHGADR